MEITCARNDNCCWFASLRSLSVSVSQSVRRLHSPQSTVHNPQSTRKARPLTCTIGHDATRRAESSKRNLCHWSCWIRSKGANCSCALSRCATNATATATATAAPRKRQPISVRFCALLFALLVSSSRRRRAHPVGVLLASGHYPSRRERERRTRARRR